MFNIHKDNWSIGFLFIYIEMEQKQGNGENINKLIEISNYY